MLDVAGEYSKCLLFMNLCIVCAYPLTPVVRGVWKTCGSRPTFYTSLQVTAIQRQTFSVDKNLFGVSGQVTASGVLVFAEIFPKLISGNEARPKPCSGKFASRAPPHRASQLSRIWPRAAQNPVAATGRHRGHCLLVRASFPRPRRRRAPPRSRGANASPRDGCPPP